MVEFFDAVGLARIQFAFVISFHILFPSFTIGLSSWLAFLEWRWLRTNNKIYQEIYHMWIKIFAICFGVGVVSGVVMAYQFGTNWSSFSDQVANVIGPLLGYEVLTAFFLEASFLGIMLFGWGRVSNRMHFVSTCVVAVGTILSAFWILSANSWMQTPQGFMTGADGLLYPTSWMEIIFNPSFPYRFAHMVTASYLTTTFVVGGIGAFYLWRGVHIKHARVMFGTAMVVAFIVSPVQLLIGHSHGRVTMEHQPIKVAAIESNWERGTHKPAYLFGWPNEKTETNDYGITIPGGASWILTGSTAGEIPGLRDVSAEDRPPVAVVFWSFRIMAGIGLAMIITGLIAAVLYVRKRLFDKSCFHLWCMAMLPSGSIAVLAGWFVTEVGRQPYLVYGVIRTVDGISPVPVEAIIFTLLAFIVVYTAVGSAVIYYISRLICKGPEHINDASGFNNGGVNIIQEKAEGIIS